MSLLLRSDKGAPLTHAEMDDNWEYSAVQLGLWSSTYTYSVNNMTVYGGTVYKALTPNLNTIPSANPSDWQVWVPSHTHGFADISSAVLDEDNMASNSDVHVPTQQSVKAYVDSRSGGGGANLQQLYFMGQI